MRDLSFVDAVHTREELRARIEDPARFRPQPRVVRPIPWRRGPDGACEVQSGGAWRPLHPAVAAVYEGLERGEPLEELIVRAEALVEKKLPGAFEAEIRRHLLALAKAGHVHIPFEDPPAAYAGRYERVRELGRGGMGVVDLCADRERDGALVVIKRSWGWTKPVHRCEATNRREARVLRQFDHPSFPRLLDAFEVGGILHMVREFVDGPILSPKVVPTWKERREVGAQIADALAHMHERRYLYLDAKPGNFILGVDGRIRVIDLGVARTFDEIAARPGQRVGSPGFTAPEIRRRQGATPLSDQYSLGALLFTLATGGRPRRGWDETGIPRALQGVDADERDAIVRMTRWDPSERYADMREAAAALRG